MANPAKPRRNVPTRPPASAEGLARNGIGARLILVWGWLAIYLVAFFLAPLASAPPGAAGVVRRGNLWSSLLLADEVFQRWIEGCTWHALGQRGMILLVAGTILAVATAAGSIGLRALGVGRTLTRLERFVLAAGVGLNGLSLFTLVLGLCGALRYEIVVAAGLTIVLVEAVFWWRQRSGRQDSIASATHLDASARETDERLQISRGWLWLALPFVAVILLGGLMPPLDFDVREYHLQAPKEFYLSGRITFLPHNVYANMPLGTEMLSLLGMIAVGDWWIGALVGKTLIGVFAPLAALGLLAIGTRFAWQTVGVLAALVYISIPWIVLESTQGLVEGAFAFYLLMAFYAVLLWRQRRQAGEPSNRLLALAGFLAGAAVSCKYPAVVYCVLPLSGAIAYVSFVSQANIKTYAGRAAAVARPLGVFLLACSLGCGPWFAKNAVLTGNPTYPLLYNLFDGQSRTPENARQFAQAHSPPNYDPSDLLRRAADVTLSSDWLSPLLTPLAALALLGARRSRLALLVAGYFLFVFGAWWLLTHRIDRFWVPALPLLALLAGVGATWSDTRWWRSTLAFVIGIGLLFNFAVLTGGQLVDNRYLADLQVLRADPQRIDPWHAYLNQHAAEVTGVLLVGDAQPFDLDVPVLYNTVFDDCLFEQIARGRTSQQVQAALDERKISHVYVAWGEIDRYRSQGNYGITDYLQPEVFDRLVAAGVLEAVPQKADHAGQLFRVVRRGEVSKSSR